MDKQKTQFDLHQPTLSVDTSTSCHRGRTLSICDRQMCQWNRPTLNPLNYCRLLADLSRFHSLPETDLLCRNLWASYHSNLYTNLSLEEKFLILSSQTDWPVMSIVFLQSLHMRLSSNVGSGRMVPHVEQNSRSFTSNLSLICAELSRLFISYCFIYWIYLLFCVKSIRSKKQKYTK